MTAQERNELVAALDQLRADCEQDRAECPPQGFLSWSEYRCYQDSYYPRCQVCGKRNYAVPYCKEHAPGVGA